MSYQRSTVGPRRGVLALACLALATPVSQGCTHATYRVIPSGTGISAAPRLPNCAVVVFRTRVERPYDELAAVQVQATKDGFFLATAEELQRLLGSKACELGADAVLVTQDYRSDGAAVEMTGVAIKYRGEPDAPAGAR